MIDPKELRIGNWLQGKPFNAPRMGISSNGETQITGEGIAAIERRLITNYSYSPIPLTPEWLERLGFEYDKYMLWWTNKKVSIFNAIRTTNNKDFFVVSCYGQTKPIRSVHELQNLIFCLTGEEL